jgi:tRNA A-37 threonylcarbamoyl transferase component Bud32
VSDLVLALATGSAPTGTIAAGTRLGKYEVLELRGSGGMAEVYVARAHEAAGVTQWAVIKRVLPHLARDPEFVRMFLDEAKITASLDHPNIAHVKEVGRGAGEFFIALEFVHGVDLKRILKESAVHGPVPYGPALTIVGAVADALDYAHERGIVHRDVTPSNIMVTYEGHAKVLDFGIAKAARTAMTRAGTIKGKVGYMSPEQCLAEEVDRRTDVFALGILLYEITLGRKLFRGDSDFAIMNQITLGRITPPRGLNPQYPEELEAIVLQALALDPAARFQSARAFASAVDDFAHGHAVRTSPAVVAGWMRAVFGEAPPMVVATERAPITARDDAPVLATRWSLPGKPRRSRMVAIGLLGGALGIGIGAATVAILQSSPASTTDADQGSAVVATPAEAPPVATAEVTPPPAIPAAPQVTSAEAVPAAVVAEPVRSAERVREDKPRKRRTKRRSTSDPTSSLFPPSRAGTRK